MATFVLVHGAWHGGWCWDEVVPRLKARGHIVEAPDLPGMGTDKTPLSKVDLSRWTLFVSDMVMQAFEPVVLLGHSRGGLVISEVAQLVPDRISTLVYLAAFLVPDGKTLSDMLGLSPGREVARDTIVPAVDGITCTIKPEKVAPVFYNTSPPALAARAAEMVGAEPLKSFGTPVRTTADRFGRVKRAYIECLQDNAIPIELQRLMREALPCEPVVTLDCDHSPFFSMPDALCDALDKLCQLRGSSMYQLFIANKNYSSWSLRPWVLLRERGIAFEEKFHAFTPGGSYARFRAFSPTGKVPTLVDGSTVVWDSLAIAEYVAERHEGVWPKDAAARAWARCAAAEMHSGFQVLRERCSMNCGLRVKLHEMPEALVKDINRVGELWNEGLKRFGGPFLAGPAFTAVDAFFAPVAFRIQTYGLKLDPAAQAYAQRLLDLPSMKEWYGSALAETLRDEHDDFTARHGTIVQDLRARTG